MVSTAWKTNSINVKNSSIVHWAYQDNFKPVYFFNYKKISRARKHSQANINQQSKINQTLNNKGNNFCAHKLLREWKSLVLRLVLFVRANLFCKKKVNRLKTVLIASINYTTYETGLIRLQISDVSFKSYTGYK